MSAHDRFEALAGAYALGEATAAERAELIAHAAGCSSCRGVVDDGPALREAIARARDAETWRPALAGRVHDAVRTSRTLPWTLAFASLGGVFVGAFVLQLALGSGLSGRVTGTVHAPSTVALVPAAPRRAAGESQDASARELRAVHVPLAPVRTGHPVARAARATRLAAPQLRTHTPSPDDVVQGIFAGLTFDANRGRRVAVERVQPCSPEALATGCAPAGAP